MFSLFSGIFFTVMFFFLLKNLIIIYLLIRNSGIALAISFKPKSFIYVHYLIRNYIRYTLPIIVSIGMIYVVPLFGSGPLWHLFDQTMTQPCKDNIWSALFFTNNFQNNIEDMVNSFLIINEIIFLKNFHCLTLVQFADSICFDDFSAKIIGTSYFIN